MAAKKKLSVFEKYLTLWVLACILAGILLGRLAPQVAVELDALSVYQVSLPIAACLFFMMYPIMVKIDFSQVVRAGKTPRPVLLTLFVNWAVKPFTMYAIATFFVGYVFRGLVGGPRSSRPARRWSFGEATSPDAFCWASPRARRWY